MDAKIIFEEAQKVRYKDYRKLQRVLHEAALLVQVLWARRDYTRIP